MRHAIGLEDDQSTFGRSAMTCLCSPQTVQLEREFIGTA